MPVSIRPGDAVVGGSAFPVGVEMEVVSARFAPWDYNGTSPVTVAARFVLKDTEDKEYTQYWSVGNPSRYTIIEDGLALDGPPISKGCNFNLLMEYAVNKAGFPVNRLETIASFEGAKLIFQVIPAPKRAGLENQKEGAALYMPEKFTKLPGEKKPAAKTTAAKTTAAKDADKPAVDEIKNAIKAHVSEVLGKYGGAAKLKDIGSKVWDKDYGISDSPHKKEVAKAIYTENFKTILGELGFSLEGELVKA